MKISLKYEYFIKSVHVFLGKSPLAISLPIDCCCKDVTLYVYRPELETQSYLRSKNKTAGFRAISSVSNVDFDHDRILCLTERNTTVVCLTLSFFFIPTSTSSSMFSDKLLYHYLKCYIQFNFLRSSFIVI